MDTSMGNLKPGVTYIYERDGPTIYAREFGATERQVVGYDEKLENQILGMPSSVMGKIMGIYHMAQDDPGMQELWTQLEMLYNLKKTHE
jgi:hypothetical protein